MISMCISFALFATIKDQELVSLIPENAQTITDALRILRLKLLKCAGIALFTVTSFFAPLAFVTDYAIQVIRI